MTIKYVKKQTGWLIDVLIYSALELRECLINLLSFTYRQTDWITIAIACVYNNTNDERYNELEKDIK